MLIAQHIRKSYGQQKILKGCSFQLAPGTITGLIGENGAGKSTLLHGLCGLQTVLGTVSVNGIDCQKLTRAEKLKHIAFMSDANCLPLGFSIKRLIALCQSIYPHFKILPWLHDFPINQPMANFSKGMRAQVHLALTLGQDKPILILDEPTLGLDVIARDTFYQHLNDCMNEKKIVLISSHQVEELEQFINHVLFMKAGELIIDQSTDSLLNNHSIVDRKLDNPSFVHELTYLDQKRYLYQEKFEEGCQPSLREIFIAYGKQTCYSI
ncbi:MAG TPA: ABC transporter ATP-binding protein [Candidatus Limnocylindria bacterium]|nr:ABC transporter ATP-binding protein [Candidatus Limnocylindria bacterium]